MLFAVNSIALVFVLCHMFYSFVSFKDEYKKKEPEQCPGPF